MSRSNRHYRTLFSFLGILFFTLGCSREVTECGGAPIDKEKLLRLKQTAFTSGPKALLIVPNPIDATQNAMIQSTDSALMSVTDPFLLPNLLSANRLENNFLKIRIKSINDEVSTLARPNAQGAYAFQLHDVHYGETMAYHSLSAIQEYVENLGFSTIKNRPLYVMVRAPLEGEAADTVNAFYSHNYLNPSMPRTMQLFGETQYAPSEDRDIYWHEYGHYLFESLSAERGVDFAGDSGALFTEGAALHECLADYLTESVSGKGYIGRWIARNFSNIPAGDPLRSAEAKKDDLNDFQSVALFDSAGKNLDRYRMAEWCTRVLWDLRTQFVKEDPATGSIFSDRLVFSAASLLRKDASVSEFQNALTQADKEVYCGLHSQSIEKAFSSRGFKAEPKVLEAPLKLKVNPVALADSDGKSTGSFGFEFQITNPNSETARNVRLVLESPDSSFIPDIYLQAYGDLAGGNTITAGRKGPLSVDYSVQGTSAQGNKTGHVRYHLRVIMENGPEGTVDGSF